MPVVFISQKGKKEPCGCTKNTDQLSRSVEGGDLMETSKPKLIAAAVLPEQFYGLSREMPHSRSEIALRCAILDEAFHCFKKQFLSHTRRDRRLAQEAEGRR
jgi:hypothetical protein